MGAQVLRRHRQIGLHGVDNGPPLGGGDFEMIHEGAKVLLWRLRICAYWWYIMSGHEKIPFSWLWAGWRLVHVNRPKFWVNKNPTQIRSGQRCGHGAALFRPAWQHAIVDHTNLDRIQVILFDSPCAVNLSVQLPIQTNKLFTN